MRPARGPQRWQETISAPPASAGLVRNEPACAQPQMSALQFQLQFPGRVQELGRERKEPGTRSTKFSQPYMLKACRAGTRQPARPPPSYARGPRPRYLLAQRRESHGHCRQTAVTAKRHSGRAGRAPGRATRTSLAARSARRPRSRSEREEETCKGRERAA